MIYNILEFFSLVLYPVIHGVARDKARIGDLPQDFVLELRVYVREEDVLRVLQAVRDLGLERLEYVKMRGDRRFRTPSDGAAGRGNSASLNCR